MPISRALSGTAVRTAAKLDSAAITDDRLASTLGVYAGMVAGVLDRPEQWLAVDSRSVVGGAPAKALRLLRRTVSGDLHPMEHPYQLHDQVTHLTC